jgi:hypothetical protein
VDIDIKIMKRRIIILLLTLLCACQATPTPSETTSRDIKYVGVNLEKLCYDGTMGCVLSDRLWDMFTEGRYQPDYMEAFLQALAHDFNTVRFFVGMRHLIHPDVREGYIKNLIHTLQIAQENGVYVVIGGHPAGIYPYDEWDGRTSDTEYGQFDPYFDPQGFENYKLSMQILAQVISENGFEHVLYIDLRNEINGHIGDAYIAGTDYEWGYVPDRASHSFQEWLEKKYSTVNELNASWGAKYSNMTDIPVFHSYTEEILPVFSHPETVSEDIQEWLIYCLRDWVSQLRDIIKSVDPSLKVAQSTTSDGTYVCDVWEINTRCIYRQAVIADLVDVLDYHMYKPDYTDALKELREQYPDKPFISGEFYEDIAGKVDTVRQYGDGIIFWSSGCARDYHSLESCAHYWDTWELTSAGKELYMEWKGE